MTASSFARERLSRPWRFLPLLAGLVLVLAACGTTTSSQPSTAASVAESAPAAESAAESATESATESAAASEGGAAGGVEITVAETSAGSALAGADGMTLYTFDEDTAGQSACSGGCVDNWPPFLSETGEEPTAGAGVDGRIGSITRDDGGEQVTYNGLLLYYYAGDEAAGDANGDGVGGVWHIAVP